MLTQIPEWGKIVTSIAAVVGLVYAGVIYVFEPRVVQEVTALMTEHYHRLEERTEAAKTREFLKAADQHFAGTINRREEVQKELRKKQEEIDDKIDALEERAIRSEERERSFQQQLNQIQRSQDTVIDEIRKINRP